MGEGCALSIVTTSDGRGQEVWQPPYVLLHACMAFMAQNGPRNCGLACS